MHKLTYAGADICGKSRVFADEGFTPCCIPCRSTAGLGRWAAEVARHGTFAAPLPEERAAAALGALPVPYLTIANKADLAGTAY